MRLDRLILREIHLPLREPFRISSGEIHERKILLCELTDADGATVMSECVAGETPNYTPETLETAWLALTTWIAPRLLGVELAHPRDVHALLEKDFRGHNMAKAAVEMGMWGLESVRRGMPLADFMGGTRARVPVGISLGIQRTPEALVAKAEAGRLDMVSEMVVPVFALVISSKKPSPSRRSTSRKRSGCCLSSRARMRAILTSAACCSTCVFSRMPSYARRVRTPRSRC